MFEMVVDKCCPGYIANRKKISVAWLAGYVAAAAAIFLAGYLWFHTRANVFTVLAVLLVLPAAKRVVNLVVMIPRKSVSGERFERIRKEMGEGELFADYVFTSTEKIMHLDFVVIKSGYVFGVTAPSRQDAAYMKKYLEDGIKRVSPDFAVQVFDTDEQMIQKLGKIDERSGRKSDGKAGGDVEDVQEDVKRVRDYLHSLAV